MAAKDELLLSIVILIFKIVSKICLDSGDQSFQAIKISRRLNAIK